MTEVRPINELLDRSFSQGNVKESEIEAVLDQGRAVLMRRRYLRRAWLGALTSIAACLVLICNFCLFSKQIENENSNFQLAALICLLSSDEEVESLPEDCSPEEWLASWQEAPLAASLAESTLGGGLF